MGFVNAKRRGVSSTPTTAQESQEQMFSITPDNHNTQRSSTQDYSTKPVLFLTKAIKSQVPKLKKGDFESYLVLSRKVTVNLMELKDNRQENDS